MIPLQTIETELKKRIAHPYIWYTKQNNYLDKATNFIYSIQSFEHLERQIQESFQGHKEYTLLKNYAMNRWYNFWSAIAIEDIFCSFKEIQAAKDKRDRLVDFYFNGIQFDHKTTVFPKRFVHYLNYALNNRKGLIDWLYLNQSKQQRMHYKNRLFVVLYAHNHEHWKLKAEIQWIKEIISHYIKYFKISQVTECRFENGEKAYADIIWAVR